MNAHREATAKTLDRVRKLVALAARNPSQNEATVAALEACRILYHEPTLLSGGVVERVVEREVVRNVRVEVPVYVREEGQGAAPSAASAPKRIHSRYSGFCRRCGQSYSVGEIVWWVKGIGCAHSACHRPGQSFQ